MASKYLKHTFTLLSGIGIGQILSLLSLPLLTRLYTSEQIGAYFFVYALAGIGSAILSLQSHLTIVRANSLHEAHQNLSYSITINLATHFFLMVICGMVYVSPLMGTFIGKAGVLLLYCPVLSFLMSTQLSFDNFYNHQQQYKKLRRLKISRSAIMVGLQLLLPLIWNGNVHFLVLAQIAGLALVLALNWMEVKPLIIVGNKHCWAQYREQQKDILIYSTAISIVNTISTNIPYLLITYFFGAGMTGYYGMAHRIVGMPLNLLGESIGVVFYQKGAQLKNYSHKLKPLFSKTLSMLVKFGIGPALVALLLAKPIFTVLLGSDWTTTGTILQIITPWLFLVYVNSAISYLISILQFQQHWIKYEVAHLAVRSLAIWIGYWYFQNPTISIALLTVVGVAFNIFFLMVFIAKIKAYEHHIKQ
jgi:O-antigen/teichoic acid export membrane protein